MAAPQARLVPSPTGDVTGAPALSQPESKTNHFVVGPGYHQVVFSERDQGLVSPTG
jgi:hypothetical protein